MGYIDLIKQGDAEAIAKGDIGGHCEHDHIPIAGTKLERCNKCGGGVRVKRNERDAKKDR